MGNTFIFQVSFGIWRTRIRCWLGFFRWCFEKIFIWTWIRNNTCAFLSWSRPRRRRCCLFGRLRNITWRLLLVFFRYSFSWSISFWNFKYFINSIYMQYIYNWGELNISQNSVIFVTEYFYWCEKNMILKSFAKTLRNSFDFRWKFKICIHPCEWHFVLVCWYKWTYIIWGNYIPFVLRLLWDSFPIFKSKFNKLLSRLMNVQREFWSILVWKRQQHSSRFSTSQSFSKRIVAELL